MEPASSCRSSYSEGCGRGTLHNTCDLLLQRSEIEKPPPRVPIRHNPHRMRTPEKISAGAQQMVREIVARSDSLEHCAHCGRVTRRRNDRVNVADSRTSGRSASIGRSTLFQFAQDEESLVQIPVQIRLTVSRISKISIRHRLTSATNLNIDEQTEETPSPAGDRS